MPCSGTSLILPCLVLNYCQAIADVHGLNADKIVCGNGSDEILDLIYRSYLRADDEVILSTNHFVMCALYAKIQGAKIVLDSFMGSTCPAMALVRLGH